MEIGIDSSSGVAWPHFKATSDGTGTEIDALSRHWLVARHVDLMRPRDCASAVLPHRRDGCDWGLKPGELAHLSMRSPVLHRQTQVRRCYRQCLMQKVVGLKPRRGGVPGRAWRGQLDNLYRVSVGVNFDDCATRFQRRPCRSRTRDPLPTMSPPSVDDSTVREAAAPAKLPTDRSGAPARREVRRTSLPGADRTGSGAGYRRVGVTATLDIRRSLQGGKSRAPALPAVHFTEESA